MKSGINSINVGVAASIIMFDAGIKKRKIWN
jgi:tRNA G18 (ribose-2'-O)-methylase SpoU